MMRSLVIGVLLGGLAALPAAADCRYSDTRSAVLDVGDAELLVVEAAAGALRIEGKAGLTQVRVTGKACASSRDLLEDIQVHARQRGNRLYVTAEMPETGWRKRGEARLDLALEVPADLALDVDDGSGDLVILGVGSLRLEDGSGDARIEGVTGAVDVDDGSGELGLFDIGGDIEVDDGSGDIEIRRVGGSVRIVDDGSGDLDIREVRSDVVVEDDGSGDIVVADVGGDVLVGDDGSGAIRVRQVSGNLTVEDAGSGSISYEKVDGSVRVPGRRW